MEQTDEEEREIYTIAYLLKKHLCKVKVALFQTCGSNVVTPIWVVVLEKKHQRNYYQKDRNRKRELQCHFFSLIILKTNPEKKGFEDHDNFAVLSFCSGF